MERFILNAANKEFSGPGQTFRDHRSTGVDNRGWRADPVYIDEAVP
jgi:hypothetical protein